MNPRHDPHPTVPEDSGAAEQIASLEARVSAVEDLVDRVRALAESANHIAAVQLTSDVAGLQRTMDGVQTMAQDLQRMAEAVWDQTAVMRRLARLEDLLAESGVGSAPEYPAPSHPGSGPQGDP